MSRSKADCKFRTGLSVNRAVRNHFWQRARCGSSVDVARVLDVLRRIMRGIMRAVLKCGGGVRGGSQLR